MYGYYAGDNERNDYDVIENIEDAEIHKKSADKINLQHAPYVEYNHKLMKKKHTSIIEMEKAQKEAKELLDSGDVNQMMKDKLMFEKQSVS